MLVSNLQNHKKHSNFIVASNSKSIKVQNPQYNGLLICIQIMLLNLLENGSMKTVVHMYNVMFKALKYQTLSAHDNYSAT